jgi:hypothetical protein
MRSASPGDRDRPFAGRPALETPSRHATTTKFRTDRFRRVTTGVDSGGGGGATTNQGYHDLAKHGWTVRFGPGRYYENLPMPSQAALASAGGFGVTSATPSAAP